MNSDSSQYLDDQYPDSLGGDILSIALIGPDEGRRRAANSALAGSQGGEIREFSSYPASLDDVPKLMEQQFDVIIIDLDSHPEYALELVESLCVNGAATVMVYSMKTDSELLVRCMRAGAREFLTLPFSQTTMAEALVRASARRPATRPAKKVGGKLMVFLGAKGGDGVTTLACNFAVSLAQESGQSTLLVDFDLPLGDAALNLGVVAEYSTINALQNAARLDSSFLSKLLVKHSSGVSVLAAPGKFPQFDATPEAFDRLLSVARQDFDNVVVDMGSRLDLMGTSLFKAGSTVYLVIQAGIAGLRNSNRLISQYFTTEVPKLEIVINRFEPRNMGVSEDQITKALTRPAQWKIPNDYAAVRRMQTTAVPLALEDSPISRLIRQMARTSCNLPLVQEKKAGFSLKSLSRSLTSRVSTTDEGPALTQLGLGSGPTQVTPNAVQTVPAKHIQEKPVNTSPAATPRAANADHAETKGNAQVSASSSRQPGEPETRIYKGATYVKGANGEWHLQEAERVSPPKQQSEPETRTYKGAVYVKGADGEWQLLKTEPEAAKPAVSPVVTPALTFAVTSVVNPETPVIAWSTPAPIAYGIALSTTQLRAMASVPGKFAYTPGAGKVLPAGTHTLTVAFTPTDSTGYTTAEATVLLTVTKATPVIIWPTPEAVVYGTALSASQLNAETSVPGSFAYVPAEGELLGAGEQTLTATFTPQDASSCTTAAGTVSLTVTKATPEVAWQLPASIVYGTALNDAQLNATASVAGSFTYAPAAGEVLTAGVQTLSATFTPEDAANYKEAEATVSITVTKATPVISWPTPAAITYGTALSAEQLSASSPVEGKFSYIPSLGAVLSAGTHTPSVTFTPTDTKDYKSVRAAVSLTVTKAMPEILWPTPDAISYGTALSGAQLNATASVTGRLDYTPAAGEVLVAGDHTLSVTFTPIDTTDYSPSQYTVPLTVTKAASTIIEWPTPAAITHGTALGGEQLKATAPVPGEFVYTPAAGEVLTTGTHTLSVTFTPKDKNIPSAQATVSLTVTKATPVLTWPEPDAITYGTALSAVQQNATAFVPGKFAYAPLAGEVLTAGKHMLSVTFTPAESAELTTAQATVSLTVTKATPVITWPAPAALSYGTPLSAEQLNAKALVRGTFVYTPAAGTVLAAGNQTLSVTFLPTDTADYTPAQANVTLIVEELANLDSLMPVMAETDSDLMDTKGEGSGSDHASDPQRNAETRTYKGATYVKGADGQWYLQKK